MVIRIRPIEPSDDVVVRDTIIEALTEFDIAGPGTSAADGELLSMSRAYRGERSAYFVAMLDGVVIGGAGVAPLEGGTDDTCELKKMYLNACGRSRGAGRMLFERCLSQAGHLGFRFCYLETMTAMHAARHLYEQAGFLPLDAPLGSTGHSSATAGT